MKKFLLAVDTQKKNDGSVHYQFFISTSSDPNHPMDNIGLGISAEDVQKTLSDKYKANSMFRNVVFYIQRKIAEYVVGEEGLDPTIIGADDER